jgi:hypothetical protein
MVSTARQPDCSLGIGPLADTFATIRRMKLQMPTVLNRSSVAPDVGAALFIGRGKSVLRLCAFSIIRIIRGR